MADEADLATVTAIIKGLARASTLSREFLPLIKLTWKRQKILGNDSDAKDVLELELGLLVQRIRTLKLSTTCAVYPAMLDTLGETAALKPPFSDTDNGANSELPKQKQQQQWAGDLRKVEKLVAIKRELRKHQQANKAF
ncbi:hypothetical protein DL98DRAFT_537324 [Cadophora sp. DSE1049]|nr:hypothetical protein DL98DRAFT_537324 [Cadophora sp. DSE1049]